MKKQKKETGKSEIQDKVRSFTIKICFYFCGKVGSQILKRLLGFSICIFFVNYDPYLTKKQIRNSQGNLLKISKLDNRTQFSAKQILFCSVVLKQKKQSI